MTNFFPFLDSVRLWDHPFETFE